MVEDPEASMARMVAAKLMMLPNYTLTPQEGSRVRWWLTHYASLLDEAAQDAVAASDSSPRDRQDGPEDSHTASGPAGPYVAEALFWARLWRELAAVGESNSSLFHALTKTAVAKLNALDPEGART